LSPARRIDVDLRAEALKAFRVAIFEARHETARAKTALLNAQRLLVEAFLEDRKQNARFFVWAHRIGVIREGRQECRWTYDSEHDNFSLECPMQGIHSRVGVSVALISRHTCSICGAGDFGCEHIQGEVYGGLACEWEQTDIWIDHVAITQNPDFTYTFHNSIPRSRREVEEELGGRWEEVDEHLVRLARRAGLDVLEVIPLRERGNSAQQMASFGRRPSRESAVLIRRRTSSTARKRSTRVPYVGGGPSERTAIRSSP
jgi:hypothetical protein